MEANSSFWDCAVKRKRRAKSFHAFYLLLPPFQSKFIHSAVYNIKIWSSRTNSFRTFRFVYFIEENVWWTYISFNAIRIRCWPIEIWSENSPIQQNTEKDSLVQHLFMFMQRSKWFFSDVSRTGICPEWQIVVDISLLLIVLWNWTLACKCGLSSMPMMHPYILVSFTKIHFCYPLKLRFFRFSLTSLLVWQ